MQPRFNYTVLRTCPRTGAIMRVMPSQNTGLMSFFAMLGIAKLNSIPRYSTSGRSTVWNTTAATGYKIASPESTWLTEKRYHELMEAIYETGERYMVSSGKRHMDAMTNYMEPDVLFYCKAGYPAVVEDADVSYMADLSASP